MSGKPLNAMTEAEIRERCLDGYAVLMDRYARGGEAFEPGKHRILNAALVNATKMVNKIIAGEELPRKLLRAILDGDENKAIYLLFGLSSRGKAKRLGTYLLNNPAAWLNHQINDEEVIRRGFINSEDISNTEEGHREMMARLMSIKRFIDRKARMTVAGRRRSFAERGQRLNSALSPITRDHHMQHLPIPIHIDQCPDCPKFIRFTPNTSDHAYAHILGDGEAALSVKYLKKYFGRQEHHHSAILGPIDNEFLMELMIKENIAQNQLRLDPRAAKAIANGEELGPGVAVDFDITFPGDEDISTLRLVICNQEVCEDIPGKRSFERGELISVIPICGPNVYKIPRSDRLQEMIDRGVETLPAKNRIRWKKR